MASSTAAATGAAQALESTDLLSFPARNYQTTQGRFISPDPAGLSAVDLTNPQTLNRYAYVQNNPLNGTDRTGMYRDLWAGGGPPCFMCGSAGGNVDYGAADNELGSNTPSDLVRSANGLGSNYDASVKTQLATVRLSAGWVASDSAQSIWAYNSAQQQKANPKAALDHNAVVSYWWTGAGGFGHIGIGVDTTATTGFSTFDPSTPWWQRLFGFPGARTEPDVAQHTDPDGNLAPVSYIYIAISAYQAQAMQAAIDARTNNPGRYNLLLNNCAGFVESVLHAGGVPGVPHSEVFGPAVLAGILAFENTGP